MKKKLLFVLILITLLIATSCQNNSANTSNKIQIAVSIVPQETFVKAVAEDLVNVVTLIPPGRSPANYQPTPKEMSAFSQSAIYFSIGVPTEEANIFPNIVANNETVKVIKLDEIVAGHYPVRYFNDTNNEHDEHDHSGKDPHIWMSPQRAIIMVEAIRDELISLDPSHKSVYETNAKNYINELESLHEEIETTLHASENNTFIIMHPSMGYFADDYHLNMIALEKDGKVSTAGQLQIVIDYAKEKDIHVVFYQSEFDAAQAETLAREIKGQAMPLEALSADYINNLKNITNTFKETF